MLPIAVGVTIVEWLLLRPAITVATRLLLHQRRSILGLATAFFLVSLRRQKAKKVMSLMTMMMSLVCFVCQCDRSDIDLSTKKRCDNNADEMKQCFSDARSRGQLTILNFEIGAKTS